MIVHTTGIDRQKRALNGFHNQNYELLFLECLHDFEKRVIFLFTSMEFHQEQLMKCCRVCGKRLLKAKGNKGTSHTFECASHATELLEVFGLDVLSDECTTHPQHFCLSCRSVARRQIQAVTKGVAYRGKKIEFNWLPHQETDRCEVSFKKPQL